jgi:Xaa-Pro dipeptidase
MALANISRLAERMDQLNLDAIVATTPENVFYLTGISSVALEMFPHTGQCYAVAARDDLTRPHFICSRCEVDQFLDAEPTLGGALGYGPFFREVVPDVELTPQESLLREVAVDGLAPDTPREALAATLRRLEVSGGRVAVDENGVAQGYLAALRESLDGANVVAGADVFRWTRRVKTPDEVRRVAEAAAVSEAGIRATIGIARPGVTEWELVREFERAVVTAGGRPRFTLIKFGRAAVAGQTRPTHRPLAVGDTIWFDVGGVCQGYWSDIARVYSLGEPPEKVARYHAAMLAGEQRAIAEARPDMTGKQLFDLTVEAVRESGVPHYRRHHVGHGIGVEVYDQVLITPNNDDVIEDGTIVNIETPYYEFGFGAVHVEDPFTVRAGGNELLTTLDRGLGVITEHDS